MIGVRSNQKERVCKSGEFARSGDLPAALSSAGTGRGLPEGPLRIPFKREDSQRWCA
jgi:hypothetical protein